MTSLLGTSLGFQTVMAGISAVLAYLLIENWKGSDQ